MKKKAWKFGFLLIDSLLLANLSNRVYAQENKALFSEYRQAILKEYGIDINQFRPRLPGGEADNQPITKYPLDRLLLGVAVEMEHTSDKYLALEIATDRLEEFPDYYTRLLEMEQKAEREYEWQAK